MRKLLFVFIVLSQSVLAKDKLLNNNFKKKTYEFPLREVSVIVSDDGFYPDKIMAFQGERIHFYITSTSKKAQCFVLQKHRLIYSNDYLV